MKFSSKQKGAIAIVLMSFIGTLMGIWVRYLGEHFEVYQQVAVRAFAGFLLGFLFCRNRLRLKAIKSMPKKDLFLLIFRSLVIVIGIGLYSASILQAKFANVSFIFSLPTTAFLGVIFLREKLTFKKFFLMITAFIGTAIVSTSDVSDVFNWGYGEILALVSTFFYSLAYIIRKWLSKTLNNQEISELGSLFSFIFAFIFSQVLGNGVAEFATVSPFLILIIILAGATFISTSYLLNYGFEKVEAIVANNILVLGSVFGLFVGFVVYGEIPIAREIIGGLIIIISAVYTNKIQEKK